MNYKQVKKLSKLYRDGKNQTQIASIMGISQSTVSRAIKAWEIKYILQQGL